ncbi:MAG: hypothetical protein OXU61_08290 [Gammaproteobacteria bacterium]|nr:hypothetical protein [Gammaproteobacteria bacterium]
MRAEKEAFLAENVRGFNERMPFYLERRNGERSRWVPNRLPGPGPGNPEFARNAAAANGRWICTLR